MCRFHLPKCAFCHLVIWWFQWRFWYMTNWRDTGLGGQSQTSCWQIGWFLHNIQSQRWFCIGSSWGTFMLWKDDQQVRPNCVNWNSGWREHRVDILQFWKLVLSWLVYILSVFTFCWYAERNIWQKITFPDHNITFIKKSDMLFFFKFNRRSDIVGVQNKSHHYLSKKESYQREKVLDSSDKVHVLCVVGHRSTTSLLLWSDKSVTFETTTQWMRRLRILKRLWNFQTPSKSRSNHDDQRSAFTININFYDMKTHQPAKVCFFYWIPHKNFLSHPFPLLWSFFGTSLVQCWCKSSWMCMLTRQFWEAPTLMRVWACFLPVGTITSKLPPSF